MDHLLPIAVGLGLAAASGLRVFVPLLVLGIGAAVGRVPLAEGWQWIGSTPALIALGTATVMEVAAYAVPWLDHALDVLATPAALVAGMVATASVAVDLPPVVKWGIVIIGGGGMAGLVQGASVAARLKSGIFTGGLANPSVSITELAGAVLLSLFALLVPIVTLVVLAVLLFFLFRRAGRLLFGHRRDVRAPAGRNARSFGA